MAGTMLGRGQEVRLLVVGKEKKKIDKMPRDGKEVSEMTQKTRIC